MSLRLSDPVDIDESWHMWQLAIEDEDERRREREDEEASDDAND